MHGRGVGDEESGQDQMAAGGQARSQGGRQFEQNVSLDIGEHQVEFTDGGLDSTGVHVDVADPDALVVRLTTLLP